MTRMEDTPAITAEQGETVCLKRPGGLWVELPDTWSNRRGLMIFLRCMHTSDGRPWVTFERLAEELGYADRRNVPNF